MTILRRISINLFITFIIVIGSGFYLNTMAQQDPIYSHYMFNKEVYNPGFTGSNREYICATFVARDQWAGFGGQGIASQDVGSAPQTESFSINAPLRGFLSGAGLYVINDKAGFENTITIDAAFSTKKDFTFGTLQLGLNGGVIQKSINGNWITPDGSDPSVDPRIPVGNQSAMRADLGAGLYLYTDRYYLGLSGQHLIPGEFAWTVTAKDLLARIFFLTGGYNFILPFYQNFEFQPSFIIKNDPAKLQFDLNLNILYKNKIWGGLSYREGDAFSLLLGLKLTPQLKFGYCYEFPSSSMSTLTSGSHEIFVNYCFRIVIKNPPEIPNILWNTRFL